jgi:RNA polymerase sigma-70 factor, ECF subfamily
MSRYAAGDRLAFAELHAVLAPRLYRYLLRRTRDRQRAQDLLQQALLGLHSARARFACGANVLPWAFAIARRTLVNSYRLEQRESRVMSVLLGWQEPSAPGGDTTEGKLMVQNIEDVLERLPEKQRVAFVLTKIEGLSTQEVAAKLDTTTTSVKLRVHRACVTLRAALA